MANVLTKDYGARVRHWGPVETDAVYGPALLEDVDSGELVVWDRGWAAEHVYGSLLGRDRRLAHDPFLGEFLYGRGVQANGVRCMLLGPSSTALDGLRAPDDLPVDPGVERGAFGSYGEWFGYLVVPNQHTPEAAQQVATILYDRATACELASIDRISYPPNYAGPPDAVVVFVGERRAKHATIPGSWLPLSSRYGYMLAQELGDFALRCGWTNASDCQPQALRGRQLVVALGDAAAKWVGHHVRPGRWLKLPHPAWVYRWGKARGQFAKYQDTLDSIKKEFDR